MPSLQFCLLHDRIKGLNSRVKNASLVYEFLLLREKHESNQAIAFFRSTG